MKPRAHWQNLHPWQRIAVYVLFLLNPLFPFEHYLWLKVPPFSWLTVNVLGLS